MICERCWSDATIRAFGSGRSTTEHYNELLEERKDEPCDGRREEDEGEEAERSQGRHQRHG
jgi:hypothetical protein